MRLFLAWRALAPAPRHEAYAAAHAAVCRLTACLLREAGLPADTEIQRTAEGRPFFPALPTADFSISHTDAAVFCLLAVATPPEAPPRVGLDAEPLSLPAEKAERLAKRYFCPSELQYFEENGRTVRAFLEIFTGKEAFAKYRGTGLAKTLKIDTVCPLFSKKQGVKLHKILCCDHVVTLCLPLDCDTEGLTALEK